MSAGRFHNREHVCLDKYCYDLSGEFWSQSGHKALKMFSTFFNYVSYSHFLQHKYFHYYSIVFFSIICSPKLLHTFLSLFFFFSLPSSHPFFLSISFYSSLFFSPIIIFFLLSFLLSFPPSHTGDTPLVAADKLKQTGLIYSLCLDMVINRLRFYKIVAVANRLFGLTGVAVLEELAVHGR